MRRLPGAGQRGRSVVYPKSHFRHSADRSSLVRVRAPGPRLEALRALPSVVLMMKSIAVLAACFLFLASTVRAQHRYASPILHADRTVTLQLYAPDADEVLVKHIAPVGTVRMERAGGGMWSITVGPLKPGIYYYSFSVDGAEVLDPKNRRIKKWIESRNEFEIPGDPPLLHERQSVPAGTVHHHFYTPSKTGGTREVFVYTPPRYRPRGEEVYPVLFLLHGFGDEASAWTENGRLPIIVDNLIAAGKLQPLIIVMPDGHPLPLEERNDRSDYGDRNRHRLEAELFGDLLPFVENLYPVETTREGRAIAGLSMGGGHALTIGLNHLETFAWIGAFSAACPSGEVAEQIPVLGGDADAVNRSLKLFWITCGDHDFLLERNQSFVAWLEHKGVEHRWRLGEAGGHDWKTWRRNLADFLPLLFRE